MPRVPAVDGPSVQLGSAPNAYQQTPEALGASGITRARQLGAAGTAANAWSEVVQRQQDEADQARVDDAKNQLLQRETDLTFGEEGYTRLRGAQALNRDSGQALGVEYSAKLRQSATEIEMALGNPRQRAAFRAWSGQAMASFGRKATAHEAAQQADYQQSVNAGTIELAQQRMGLSWTDPQTIAESRAAIITAVHKAGTAAGLAEEDMRARAVEALSKGHAAALTAAIDADKLDYAREYLKQAGEEMLPAARLQVQKALDIGAAETRAQDTAGSLWSKHGGDVAAALAEARQTLQGKDEDAVVQRLKVLDSERETFTRRAERTAYEGGLLALAQGRPVPPSLLAAMGEGHAAAVLEHQRAKAKAAAADAAGKPIKTDWSLYLELREQAANEPEAFAQLDLGRYVDRIGGAQLEQLIDIKGKLKAAAGKPAKAAREAVTLTQQMQATMAALKITDKAKKGQFLGFVQGEVDDATTAKGKPLTFDERQAIIDRAVLQGPDPDRILPWGERRMFELKPEQRSRFKPNAPTAAPPVRVNSDADYNALPRGTRFITPDGKTGVKS